MIHVVTEENGRLYEAEFAALRNLTEGLARAALRLEPGSIHLLALDGGGAPEFACRFRPTDLGGRIPDALAHMVAAGPASIRAAEVWERTRIYAAPHICGPDPLQRRRCGELRLAVLEEAAERGVRRIVELVPCSGLVETLRSGWRARLLGLPAAVDGVAMVAVEVDASAEAAAELRERLACGPSRRLRLKAGDARWSAPPKEIETFLEAAQQLGPGQLEPLLVALRAAVEDDQES